LEFPPMRFVWLLLASSSMLIAGCSVASIATKAPLSSPISTPTPAKVGAIKGVVHGGNQPIVGAKVYMYAVTIGAYSQASTSLMQATSNTQNDGVGDPYYVLTDSKGDFSIGALDYSCTSSGETAVYLYSNNGDPGIGSDNPNAGLMAVLGACTPGTVSTGGSFPSVTGFVNMNEVTTVAAAYALAGFATDPTHISGGTSSQGVTAVANAANNAFNLASLTTFVEGTNALSQTPGNPNSVVPQAEINTLADALAACINEASGGCTSLSNYTTNNPTDDTAAMAIYIAQHPGGNVSGIFCLVIGTGSAPFQPILSGSAYTCPNGGPNDWTIGISYTKSGLDAPTFLAVDGPGNIWVSNDGPSNTITEFSPVGNPTFTTPGGSGGLDTPQGIAIDTTSSFVWVIDDDTVTPFYALSEFSTADGSPVPASPITEGLFNAPVFLAIDGNDDLWTANNQGNTVNEFDTSGNVLHSSTNSGDGGVNGPAGVAVDTAGNVWVANDGPALDGSGTSVSEFTVTGGDLTFSPPISGGGLAGPYILAVDHAGNVWVANLENFAGTSVTEIAPGTVAPPTPPTPTSISGGGISAPIAVAVDGLGNVWVANAPSSAGSISEISSGVAVSPGAGYTGVPVAPATTLLPNPTDIAVDGSGDLWVTNAAFNGSVDSLVEFVGAAAPVVTPLAAGVKNGTLGMRP
jgi:hypothetical protein